ncbi:SpaH/EbpB family LPXTG-anchored major pilin [Homoserinibacter sp. GY 40078]|uniref:SpaH/EbpB family LPXTG-anchored major pilin n=1 Tax=Homoserinibacter sp. GY 40078 TaxID=2603275 RepID=UPI00164F3713|nr:SpaH/EbpB family LPXTG-anchored major pilin [Homoserinibacter sp. GY 40078]
MTTHPSRRTSRALLMAAALAVATFAGVASPAAADPLIDPTQTGTISVHKFEAPEEPTGLPHNGLPVDTTGLVPVEGVSFRVRQVLGIDLTTNAGWLAAQDLSDNFPPGSEESVITGAGYSFGTAEVKVTNVAGDAIFSGLSLGLYYIDETDYPTGVTPASPFLLTVPFTDPVALDDWLYNIHVYPKNALSGADKTVADANAVALGDAVTWTVTADVPNVETIDGLRIVDELDARLDYVSTDVSLANGATIVRDTDYTVVHDPSTRTLTVDFTASGRAILSANIATSIVVEIGTTANAIGHIPNVALFYPNAASIADDDPATTAAVETRWGELTLQKVDHTTGEALTGAQFQVFTSLADARSSTDPVVLDGEDTFEVVNSDGTLTISGLRYSDFADGETVSDTDPGYNTYYLVETVAPAGHELLTSPIAFIVDDDTTAVGVDLVVRNALTVVDFPLPITGGTGTMLLYGLGIAFVAGGIAAQVVRYRKQRS